MGRERTVCRSGRIVSLGLALPSFPRPSQRDWKVTAMTSPARDAVARRLQAALAEEDLSGEVYRSAAGTSAESRAHGRLRVARDEVAILEAQLKAIQAHGAGGRMWINGREVGGPNSRFLGLEESHD